MQLKSEENLVYDKDIYEIVCHWVENHRTQMIRDIQRMVRIPSISDPDAERKPYGEGCRSAMDEMLQIGREHGFYTENYEYYVGSIGRLNKNLENTIGLWNHLDVVPLGDGWQYPPFGAIEKDGYIIGRGAQDNKAPAMVMLYAMECIRELGFPMKHELCLFVGCDEERGMSDLEYYGANYSFPALSMIADSGFPVCYGEKGIIEGKALAKEEFSDAVLDLYGGSVSNMIPDKAVLELKCTKELLEKVYSLKEVLEVVVSDEKIVLVAKGNSHHSANPDGSVNAIQVLTEAVSHSQILEIEDRSCLQAITEMLHDCDGSAMGIACEDEISGKLTCAGTVLRFKDQKVSLEFNIRYPITADSETLMLALEETCMEKNFTWETRRNSKPNYFPKEHPCVSVLSDLYCEISGRQRGPFTMGGGTYARMLPNAFAYGVGGMPEQPGDKKEELFLSGHGGAHEPDEGVNIQKSLDALKIYIMALLAMNECELYMKDAL